MITVWAITGDTHGYEDRWSNLKEAYPDADINVIILGDSGCLYYKEEERMYHNTMKRFNDIGINFYMVYGNHEERPGRCNWLSFKYDAKIDSYVYYDSLYDNIKFLRVVDAITIGKKKCLVIGGAYSVDKNFRLRNNLRWFEKEQLTTVEKYNALELAKNFKFDYIFTHTCPLSIVPTHLFIPIVNQKEVDNSMEEFLNRVSLIADFDKWYCGHFHNNEILDEKTKLLFTDIEVIEVYENECN